jgi:hypothetical protein
MATLVVKSSRTKSQSLNAIADHQQMCLFYADFKHSGEAGTAKFHGSSNDSSIIRANVLSIMPAKAGQVTFD